MHPSEAYQVSQITLVQPQREDESTFAVLTTAFSKFDCHTARDRVYVTPTELDVLRGRGGGACSNIGKKRLLELVRPLVDRYASLKRGQKARLSREIVERVFGWGGRFLEMEKDCSGKKCYYIMEIDDAAKLVGQKFRDDPTKRRMFKRSKGSTRLPSNETSDDDSRDDDESASVDSELPIRNTGAFVMNNSNVSQASNVEFEQLDHTCSSDDELKVSLEAGDNTTLDDDELKVSLEVGDDTTLVDYAEAELLRCFFDDIPELARSDLSPSSRVSPEDMEPLRLSDLLSSSLDGEEFLQFDLDELMAVL